MLRFIAIPLLGLSLLLTGCQTSMLKQFEQLKPGMEKDDVLDIMGSPSQAQRFHGKDRWRYVFYDQRIRFEKEVHFFENSAIYIGEVWQPAPENSAVVADQKNEEKNKAVDAAIAKDAELHRSAYTEYEAKTKGEKNVLYVPQYEPIR